MSKKIDLYILINIKNTLGGNMKKYLMTLCLTVLFTNSVNAFTYRCIESGMTKDEYHEACNTALILSNGGNYTKEDIEADLHFGYDYAGSSLAGKSNRGSLFWTEDGLLWRIQLRYTVPDDILEKLALREALGKKFRDTEIQESSSTSSRSTTSFYTIVLMDDAVADPAIKKLVKKREPRL